uniref:Uncharacterized protein n=1 Tax=Setaria italica TaxID=4555 RepID=K3ZPP9_SETIT
MASAPLLPCGLLPTLPACCRQTAAPSLPHTLPHGLHTYFRIGRGDLGGCGCQAASGCSTSDLRARRHLACLHDHQPQA